MLLGYRYTPSVKLLGADRAFIEPAKIRDYLLSSSHPVGRFKATFFTRLGYSPDEWEKLRDHLLLHAREGEVIDSETTPFGQKHRVRGRLTGPGGKVTTVVAVWLILSGEDFPRLITAFPG